MNELVIVLDVMSKPQTMSVITLDNEGKYIVLLDECIIQEKDIVRMNTRYDIDGRAQNIFDGVRYAADALKDVRHCWRVLVV